LNIDEIKKRVSNIIEENTNKIINDGEQIAKNPELGFREFKTSDFVKDRFRSLNIPFKDNLGITGIRADLKGKDNKCRVGYLAELDALMCPNHPKADPNTGAAHVCGHNIQIAVLLGVVEAFMKAGVKEYLDGDIAFMAVPAEEGGQFEYRKSLKEKGEIKFFSGKKELISEGAFDDIDMALMFHVQIPKVEGKIVTSSATMNGVLAKYVQYKGLAAHAGSAPHLGINALNAAMLGLQAIHAQRETFKEEDCVRVHSIITKGGTAVNTVPDDVRLELYVRAKNFETIVNVSKKVDRALKAGGDAIGAEVKIENIPGSMPLNPNEALDKVFLENAKKIFGEGKIGKCPHINGSTDMGDVSQIIPAIHPWIHVVKGKLHGADFGITDPYIAYIQSAKIISWTLIDLLANGAKKGLEIKSTSQSPMTKETWLSNWLEQIQM